ncbi:MAG: thymidine phosphorylase [Bacilli bacterium]|nr:thymidine phosphorylase [Bacilli bacterium]
MIVDIINKKRLGEELDYKELDYFFNGYLSGEVKDYQMSSLLMAICINGLTEEETFCLTKIFVDSGDVLDFSKDIKVLVDKHSTGGIGDKTTLVIAPIVASCGVKVVKMSGRGLGYTGGTIDKLESIPGYNVNLTDKEIIKQVKDIGVVISSQTANLVPMDKVIYALRDVTGTVSSIGLIASSIMSKKIASGADKIVIDLKMGNGALINNHEDAKKLEDLMIKIGKIYNREVSVIINDMNTPLGYNIGNALEVLEAIDIIQGKETDTHLVDVCYDLASEMISMGKSISKEEALKEVKDSIGSGKAYNKFEELVTAQGGNLDKIKISNKTKNIRAYKNGKLTKIDALEVGKLSVKLGAGREKLDDKIDYGVGIKLNKQLGDKVRKGDLLATLYVKDNVKISNIKEMFVIN